MTEEEISRGCITAFRTKIAGTCSMARRPCVASALTSYESNNTENPKKVDCMGCEQAVEQGNDVQIRFVVFLQMCFGEVLAAASCEVASAKWRMARSHGGVLAMITPRGGVSRVQRGGVQQRGTEHNTRNLSESRFQQAGEHHWNLAPNQDPEADQHGHVQAWLFELLGTWRKSRSLHRGGGEH